ncbi:hypothetical protein TI39_contig290g00010 [Zymoseptoria brevis]|uniref:F-box domain-containing protein n=1 Tax=Zymoseptoria brevis TaxID=1047168 RepID=A0A0F4GWQ6_9PEZI|nr:hypothetical protein TI39_contig290g00010 [Zymoseptoria brevis]
MTTLLLELPTELLLGIAERLPFEAIKSLSIHVSIPKLLHLKSEDCFVESALCGFLRDHSQQLKVLSLKNCFAGSPFSDLPYTWDAFFHDLLISRPVLEKLIVTNDNIALIAEDPDDQGPSIPGNAEDSEDVKAVQKQLLDDPNRRLWVYAKLDPVSGVIVHDFAEIVTNNKTGKDQAKHDELMALVRQNREHSSNEA